MTLVTSFVNAGTLAENASATSITPTLPGSRVNGNILLGSACSDNASSHTWPPDWTRFTDTNVGGSVYHFSIAWRIVDGTEVDPVVSTGTSAAVAAQVIQWTGSTRFFPTLSSSAATGTGTTQGVSAGFNTTYADTSVIYMHSQEANSSFGTPSGWTEDSDSAGTSFSLASGHKDFSSQSSATGASQATGASATWFQVQLELISDEHTIAPVSGLNTSEQIAGPFLRAGSPGVAAAQPNNTTMSDFGFGTTSITRSAQTFTPIITGTEVFRVNIFIKKTGTPTDNIDCEVYSDLSDISDPTSGTLAATGSILGGGQLSTTAGNFLIVMTPTGGVNLTGVCSLVFSRDGGASDTDFYTIPYRTSADDHHGGKFFVENTTPSWVAVGDNNDCSFAVIVEGSNTGEYIFGPDTTRTSVVTAQLCNDPTATGFGPVDETSTTNAAQFVAGYQDGDTIHLAMIGDSGAGTGTVINYRAFDTVSGQFTVEESAVTPSFDGTSSTNAAMFQLAITVRSNGNVVIHYNGPRVANMGNSYAQTYYTERTGTNTWSAGVQVSAGGTVDFITLDCVLGASDRVHLSHHRITATAQFFTRSISSSNVLDTVAGGTTSTVQDAYGSVRYDSSGTIKIVHGTITSTPTSQVQRYDSGASVTVTSTQVNSSGISVPGARMYVDTGDGNMLYHVLRDTSSSDVVLKTSDDNGATWSASITAFGGTVNSTSTNLSRDASIYKRAFRTVAAAVVNDNSAWKYFEYLIREDVPPNPFFQTDWPLPLPKNYPISLRTSISIQGYEPQAPVTLLGQIIM